MKTLTPKEELIIIDDMILDFQRKKFKAKTAEEKEEFRYILKGIYAMRTKRVNDIDILEQFEKQKVA